MVNTKHSTLQKIDELLFNANIDCAYILEAAASACKLNKSTTPIIDLLANTNDKNTQQFIEQHCTKIDTHLFSYGDSIRLWTQIGEYTYNSYDMLELIDFHLPVHKPEIIIKTLPYSPDFKLLQELYAKIGLFLYIDDMSDDEIELFARYVR